MDNTKQIKKDVVPLMVESFGLILKICFCFICKPQEPHNPRARARYPTDSICEIVGCFLYKVSVQFWSLP